MDIPIYIRLDRPEGYDGVHHDLIVSDAKIMWPHEDVSEEIAALTASLAAAGERARKAEEERDQYHRAGCELHVKTAGACIRARSEAVRDYAEWLGVRYQVVPGTGCPGLLKSSCDAAEQYLAEKGGGR